MAEAAAIGLIPRSGMSVRANAQVGGHSPRSSSACRMRLVTSRAPRTGPAIWLRVPTTERSERLTTPAVLVNEPAFDLQLAVSRLNVPALYRRCRELASEGFVHKILG